MGATTPLIITRVRATSLSIPRPLTAEYWPSVRLTTSHIAIAMTK